MNSFRGVEEPSLCTLLTGEPDPVDAGGLQIRPSLSVALESPITAVVFGGSDCHWEDKGTSRKVDDRAATRPDLMGSSALLNEWQYLSLEWSEKETGNWVEKRKRNHQRWKQMTPNFRNGARSMERPLQEGGDGGGGWGQKSDRHWMAWMRVIWKADNTLGLLMSRGT